MCEHPWFSPFEFYVWHLFYSYLCCAKVVMVLCYCALLSYFLFTKCFRLPPTLVSELCDLFSFVFLVVPHFLGWSEYILLNCLTFYVYIFSSEDFMNWSSGSTSTRVARSRIRVAASQKSSDQPWGCSWYLPDCSRAICWFSMPWLMSHWNIAQCERFYYAGNMIAARRLELDQH